MVTNDDGRCSSDAEKNRGRGAGREITLLGLVGPADVSRVPYSSSLN